MAELNRAEATKLTAEIKNNVNNLALLMRQAWEGKAWEALSYASFAEWLAGEFQWSHTRGYQLLNIAAMNDALHEAIVLPAEWAVSDLQTRLIISAGAQDFIADLALLTTNDAKDNVVIVADSIKAIDPNKKISGVGTISAGMTTSLPTKVSGGVRDARTGMSSTYSFGVQAAALPTPTGLRRDVLLEVRSKLTGAVEIAEQRLAEYEVALTAIRALEAETAEKETEVA
jgi:hypothetical protein